MINATITPMPAAPLWAFEIWSNAPDVARRFAQVNGFALPIMGRAAGDDVLRMIRFEPAVWLVEGDPSGLADILAGDGALTAIGGGVVRVRLSGPDWRALLMEGGVFDAENPDFIVGRSAATVIEHVNVRLYVEADNSCLAYVPLSYSRALLHFWTEAARSCAIV